MRCIVITEADAGGVSKDKVVFTEKEAPTECGPEEIIVDVKFAGINWADTMIRRGTYPHPMQYPLVPGFEFSGTVAFVGSSAASSLAVGDRVGCMYAHAAGAYAEKIVCDAAAVVKLPDGVTFRDGAAVMLQGSTAWHMLHDIGAGTKAGDTLCVTAAGGGVGLHLIQLAVAAGARVLAATGSDDAKAAAALAAGAEKAVRYGEIEEAAKAFSSDGLGVSKVIDSCGGSVLTSCFAGLRPMGHVISYGEAEGRPPAELWSCEWSQSPIVRKSATFTRFHVGHVAEFFPALGAVAVAGVFAAVASGALKPPIFAVKPLSAALEAHDMLLSRKVAGKLLLAPNDADADQ